MRRIVANLGFFMFSLGALYLIYSHDQEAELMGDLLHADALFLKFTLPIAIIR